VLLLFLFFGDMPEHSRFWRAFFNAGHAALFGVIALIIHGFLRDAGQRRPLLVAFGATVALGGATELLQMLQRRGDPSLADLLRDTAGAAAFLLLVAAARPPVRGGLLGRSRFRRAHHALSTGRRAVSEPDEPMVHPGTGVGPRWRMLAIGAAAAILLAAGWTLLETSAAYIARNRAVPMLFAPDGPWWEDTFIQLEQNTLTPASPAPHATAGAAAGLLARLDMRPGRYSGITFDEVYPDWRGYRQLTLTIVSDLAEPLPMAIRIHDAAHDHRYQDRFNRRLLVQPGVNRFVIALEDVRRAPDRREMDLGRIRAILLFTHRLTRRAHIYIGPVVLQ